MSRYKTAPWDLFHALHKALSIMLWGHAGCAACVQDCTDIGPHYAVTLREWRAAWEREREAALRLGYSEAFWRKYRCASGESCT